MAYFIWKNIDSRKFGISATLPLPPAAGRNIKTIEIPGHLTPINQLEDMRKNIQLSITLGITDISKIDSINAWLQGEGELILCDDLTKMYHAYINADIVPERMSRRFAKYKAIFTCEPFRYSVFNPFNEYSVNLDENGRETDIDIYCRGTAPCEPLMYFKVSGELEITVNGAEKPFKIITPGHYTTDISDIPPGEYGITYYNYDYVEKEIYIDCGAKLAYTVDERGNKNICTNMTAGIFPTFEHEDNFINLKLVRQHFTHGLHYVGHNLSLTEFKCQNNERWY